MRLSFVAVGFIALALLTSCGGPTAAKYFKIAVDTSNLRKINRTETPSCFVDPTSNQGPYTTTTTVENNPGELEWTLFDGADNVLYLEIGNGLTGGTTVSGIRLGDAPAINFFGLIQGDSKTFKFEAKQTTVARTDMAPIATKYDETTTTIATITFKDLGQTTSGTIALQGSYTCTASAGQCPDPKRNPQGKGTCQVSLPFVARQVPVTEQHSFGQ